MKILSIYGSPRREGFSSLLHDEFLKPLRAVGAEVIPVYAYELRLNPCISCGRCKFVPECVHFDDDMNSIYPLLRNVDFISVSSPLYFSSFPAPLKTIIDRCQLLWEESERNKSPFKEKKGVFICTAGAEYRDMFTGILLGIFHFFNTINASFIKEDAILFPNTDLMGKISLEIIEKAVTLAKRYTGL